MTADVKNGATSAGRTSPRSLIVTLYGLYARDDDGWMSVASLIRLMAELGVDAPAVRSSIMRLKRRGVLEARRVDGAAGYALSERGREVLAEGDNRIFGRTRAELGDGWLLAIFSVPETERQKRHLIRSRLTWLGFGNVASATWIAPAHLYQETREVLERDELADFVTLFRGEYLAFGDPRAEVARWWDLPGLGAMYQEFLDEHTAVLKSWRDEPSDAAAFAAYVQTLNTWRRLPFLDPGLPHELLPADWHGTQAADLFAEIRSSLAEPAARFAASVLSAGASA